MKQNKDFNLDEFLGFYDSYTKEVSKVIVGNTDVVKGILICLLSKGHVLLKVFQEWKNKTCTNFS